MFKKSDIQFHSDGFRYAHAAVNVKVDMYLPSLALPIVLNLYKQEGDTKWREVRTHPLFTHDWIAEHAADDHTMFDLACQDAWSDLNDYVEQKFGPNYSVGSEGRSGGWAVVYSGSTLGSIIGDRDEVASWNAIDVARWGRFAHYARVLADDVPHQVVTGIYFNIFQPWLEEQRDVCVEAIADDAARQRLTIYAAMPKPKRERRYASLTR